MASVHATAARGFAAVPDAYERGRPGYPPEAVAAIGARLALGPGSRVVELGAGTGKLTRLLVPLVASVVAVEPLEAMRAKLAELVPAPNLAIVDGTAEAIPLPNGSVDAVVVAQAFHWFDPIRALSEIHRVLRPGGRLVVACNMRDEAVPWVRALGDLVHAVEHDAPTTRGSWREDLRRSGLFGPFAVETFRQVQPLDRDGVVARVASISYVAASDPPTRAAILARFEAVLAADPDTAGREVVELPYVTEIHWAERVGPAPGTAGVVASVNVSPGGVPKRPVDGTTIRRLALDGDGHCEPEPVHGGPDQAVSLYAQEAIERVREDGHEAFPGAHGENLTLLGLDWAALRPGDRLAFGDGDGGAILELAGYAAPCQTIAHWFVRRRIARISPSVRPEDARFYARVLAEGPVAPGMPVRVLPG